MSIGEAGGRPVVDRPDSTMGRHLGKESFIQLSCISKHYAADLHKCKDTNNQTPIDTMASTALLPVTR